MPDLIINLPNHGYIEDDTIYVSWLDGNYYVNDPDTNSFKLTVTADGANVQYDTTETEGYVYKYTDNPVTQVTGLDHLEGEYVYVVSNGTLVHSGVVSGGAITVGTVIQTYSVGKLYAAKVRTMRFAVPGGENVQTRVKRISETTLRYIKTKNGSMGQEVNGTEHLTNINAEYSTESTDKSILTKGGFSTDGYTVIKSTEPYPMTILGIVVEVEVWER